MPFQTSLPPSRSALLQHLALALLLFGYISSASADELPTFEWTGTVRVTMHGPKVAGDGSLETTWNLNVRWREADRIPVRDNRGRLAGEFVLLEDDGTTWSGSRHGQLESQRNCSLTINRYAGSGSGTRSIDTGWLYFSNVADGNLSGSLADGSYYIFSGRTGETVSGTTTRTHHDTCRGESDVDERDDSLLPLAFSLGRELFQPRPGTAEFSAERLAVTLEQAGRYSSTSARFLDTDRRRIEGNQMSGSYRTSGDAAGSLFWEVEWDVERRIAVTRSPYPVMPGKQPRNDLNTDRAQITAAIDEALGF